MSRVVSSSSQPDPTLSASFYLTRGVQPCAGIFPTHGKKKHRTPARKQRTRISLIGVHFLGVNGSLCDGMPSVLSVNSLDFRASVKSPSPLPPHSFQRCSCVCRNFQVSPTLFHKNGGEQTAPFTSNIPGRGFSTRTKGGGGGGESSDNPRGKNKMLNAKKKW